MRTPSGLLDRPPASEPVPPRSRSADRRTLIVLLAGLGIGALLVLAVLFLTDDVPTTGTTPDDGQHLDYRLGITADGDWRFLVTGG